jgi:hypothetical protein
LREPIEGKEYKLSYASVHLSLSNMHSNFAITVDLNFYFVFSCAELISTR